jgi:diacylglycerol kinase (ATP)
MKILFIVNPVAGKGLAKRLVPEIQKKMQSVANASFDIRYTERVGHATDIARCGAKSGYDIIYAVGGDGTVNEVANGLVGTGSALAILPGGSGNDFIRTVDGKVNGDNIIRDTIYGTKKLIDVGIINGRYFINIASVGFDAEVVLETQRFKKFNLSGSASYIAGLISTIFTGKSSKVKIKIGDKVIESEILLSAVANGRYYGGGMKPTPDAVFDDGLFDICVIRKLPRIKLLFLFPEFIKGKHAKFKEVSFYKSEKVSIESDDPIAINADGEVWRDKRVNFEIVKNGLYVMIP